MNKLFDPELFQRLETDIKQLVNACQTLATENRALQEKYDNLQKDNQHLQQRHLRAIQHAQAIVDELTMSEDSKEYEFAP
jgi:FtsZ-binding cell division protein ZapB